MLSTIICLHNGLIIGTSLPARRFQTDSYNDGKSQIRPEIRSFQSFKDNHSDSDKRDVIVVRPNLISEGVSKPTWTLKTLCFPFCNLHIITAALAEIQMIGATCASFVTRHHRNSKPVRSSVGVILIFFPLIMGERDVTEGICVLCVSAPVKSQRHDTLQQHAAVPNSSSLSLI